MRDLRHAVPRAPSSGLRAVCLLLAAAILLHAGVGPAAEPAAGADPPGKDTPVQARKVRPLFDGKSLRGWEVLKEFDFRDHGKIEVRDGKLLLPKGDPFTGLKWTGKFPRTGYEVSLEAMRTEGDDFFCGLVFPVGGKDCSLVIGGWGGTVIGLSNIDDEPAVENETSAVDDFEDNRWYKIRLRVTKTRIGLWIDKKQVVDFAHPDRKLTVRWEQEPMLPFGICTWRTGAAVRNFAVRELGGEKDEKQGK